MTTTTFPYLDVRNAATSLTIAANAFRSGAPLPVVETEVRSLRDYSVDPLHGALTSIGVYFGKEDRTPVDLLAALHSTIVSVLPLAEKDRADTFALQQAGVDLQALIGNVQGTSIAPLFMPSRMQAAPSSAFIASPARKKVEAVLVVDDDEGILKAMGRTLRLLVPSTQEAKSPERAFQVLRENQNIDLIITDFQLPTMSGVELIRELRKLGYKGTAVCLTSQPGSISAEVIEELKMTVMNKETNPERLYESFQKLVDPS
jgi:CheY-like chemotaxis protein